MYPCQNHPYRMHYRISLVFVLLSFSSIAQEITFLKHIEPIVQKHCSPCHRDKGTAPFPLENYEQVVKHAKMIASVTASRYMPPWKANPAYSHFANQRFLTNNEIEAIANWANMGMPQGNSVSIGVNKSQNKSTKKKPDLILKMPTAIKILGDNKQHYYCYKIPFTLNAARPVRAIEFIPGNKKRVHHASYQIVETTPKANIYSLPHYLEYNTEANNIDDMRGYNFLNLTDSNETVAPRLVFHTGWLPGTSRHVYPQGVGFTMPKKGVLLIRNLHYAAAPIDEEDQSEIHIYYADAPIKRVLEFAAFKPKNVASTIPKDTVVSYHLTLRMGSDMSLLGINPHMHKLGTYFKAFAITPLKDTIRLVEILNWDFNWQEFYRFQHPILIPKGSYINAEARYDNTERNSNNPNRPPKDILFEYGNMDDDREEMMRLILLYLPYEKGDEAMSLEGF